MTALMHHYTDDKGWKSISSQRDWPFKANQPPRPDAHPYGAYFTTFAPNTPNLAQWLRLPRWKVQYFFSFDDIGDLLPYNAPRRKNIFYSPNDYIVVKNRQQAHGKC
jgi:hypothetical protein